MKKHIFSLLTLCVALVSCTQNPDTPTNDLSGQLSILTSITPSTSGGGELSGKSNQVKVQTVETRIGVTNNVFETGDKIGLYIVDWKGASSATQVADTLEKSGNQTDNHLYTYTVANAWSATKLTNPLTWRNVSVFAYHPYQASIVDALAIPFTVRQDQSAGVLSTDYFMAGIGADNATGYTPATSATPIVLNFNHKTAHVTLNVTLPSIYNGETITTIDSAYVLDVPVKNNKLKLSNGVLTTSDAAADILPVTMAQKAGASALECEFNAVVTPHTIAQGQEVVKIVYNAALPTKGAFYLYASEAKGFVFEENKHYTVTLTADEFCFANVLTEFDVAGGTQDFTVASTKAGVNWTVKSGDKNWITVSADGGSTWVEQTPSVSGTKTYQVKVAANGTGVSRMSKLVLSNGNIAEDLELVVFQK